MALWPRSIRSRLLLVMIVGLLAALIASNLIFWFDRGRFFREMNVDHYVERVAAAVRLLESTDSARREDALRVMRTPRFQGTRMARFPQGADIDIDPTPWTREVERRLQERLGRSDVLFRMAPMRGRDRWPPRRGWWQQWIDPPPLGLVSVILLDDSSVVRFVNRIGSGRPRWPLGLMISTAMLLVAAVILSVIAVRFVVRPLRRVAEQAGQIGRDLTTPQMAETGPTEVRQVASAMNRMQTRLRQLFDERSRFLAAVSHDLRTPITRLRLRVESIGDDALRARMERDLEEMERMVRETLDFMRDDASREAIGKIDLCAMVEALIDDLAEEGQHVSFEPTSRPVVESRPLALKRCIGNLLANALAYGKNVRVAVAEESGDAVIEVLDDGPGIPESELERVFEPFYRLDESRGDNGTGLGLSIARSIAESLGGSLVLENRRTGGLAARIRLHAVAR